MLKPRTVFATDETWRGFKAISATMGLKMNEVLALWVKAQEGGEALPAETPLQEDALVEIDIPSTPRPGFVKAGRVVEHIRITGKFGVFILDDEAEAGRLRVVGAGLSDHVGMLLLSVPRFGVKMNYEFDADGTPFAAVGTAVDLNEEAAP